MARSNCSCVRPRSDRIFVPSDGCLWIEAPSSPSCSGVSVGALVATAVLPEVVDDVAGVVVLFLQATIAINSVRASIEFLIVNPFRVLCRLFPSVVPAGLRRPDRGRDRVRCPAEARLERG